MAIQRNTQQRLSATVATVCGVLLLASIMTQPCSADDTGLQPAPSDFLVRATPEIRANPGERFNISLNPDPELRPSVQGKYELLPEVSRVVGVHLVAVPRSNKFLFMERPSWAPWKTRQIAGTFDLFTRVWEPVDSPDGLFCAAQTLTGTGEVVVVGGHKESGGYPSGMQTVRLFSLERNRSRLVNTTYMALRRWYPSATLLPDGQIMVMGGTPTVGGSGGGNPNYELFDPRDPYKSPLPLIPVDPAFVKQSRKMYYPFNFVLPTGDVFSFSERMSRILVAQTGEYRKNADGSLVHGPLLPGTDVSQFPFTATVAFSPLTPTNNYSAVDVMIFGGARIAAAYDNNLLSSRTSRRMTISWSRDDPDSPWQYRFSNWTLEDMGIYRVMGDATLLPNGDVVLLNGGQVGIAGDSSTSTGSGARADYPTLWAQLYQPNAPVDNRYSILAGSDVARMYHSTAVLTPNGTILVTGCDRCYRLHSDVPSFVSSDRGAARYEYRQEIFHPPYVFATDARPRITLVNDGEATLGYDQEFTITWNSTREAVPRPPVTSVALVAPSATTHSFNMNQRVVELVVVANDYAAGTLTLRTPPHPYIAPPQWYMLFAMNGKVYSSARWLRLVDTREEGQVVPS